MSSSIGGDRGVPDQFPAGLRVLVVDDDSTCLMVLENMLRQCNYQVTKCNRAEVALSLLRENKNGFDVVMTEVHMPDMDGFKLLEHIVLEMDLPVIMMSANDSKSVVMKGVTHGAWDYLIKPIRIEALRNIWQHVVRRCKTEKHKAEERDYSSSLKKPRVVWSVELHQQFVAAVNQLGINEAVPKKILELMNVPGLTRESVASHLQKYRLYLRRLRGSLLPSGMNSGIMGDLDAGFRSMSLLNGQMGTLKACDHRIKPVSVEVLRNISQHIVQKNTSGKIVKLSASSRMIVLSRDTGAK